MKRRENSLAHIWLPPLLLPTQEVGHSALPITRIIPPQSCVALRVLHVFLLLHMDSSPLFPPPDLVSWLFSWAAQTAWVAWWLFTKCYCLFCSLQLADAKCAFQKSGGGGRCHHIPFSFRAFWNWTYVVCLNIVLASMLSCETHFLNHYYEHCKSCIRSVIDCTYVLWYCILWGS